MLITKSIMQRTGTIILIFILALAAYSLSPFIPSLLMGSMLAVIGWRPQLWLEKRFNLPRWLGAAIHSLIWLIIIVVPLWLILEPAGEKIAPLIIQWRDEIPLLKPPPELIKIPLIGDWIAQQASPLTAKALLQFLGGHSNLVVGWVWRIWIYALHSVFAVLTVFSIGFAGDGIAKKLNMLSIRMWGVKGPQFLESAKQSAHAVMIGLIGVGVVEGLLIGISFGVTHMPLWSIWALATVFLAPIPFGAAIIILAASAWLMLTGYWINGLLVAAWGFFIIGLADLLLRPLFVGAKNRVPFILVLFSILGGVKVFGFIGIIIGPMAISLAGALMDELPLSKPENPLPATQPDIESR
ncbi:MAG: AI-2E family transporter [Pseudomonadota bacterium]|nr:AI-2E family transporter [Pseudomonadota bacterium]